MIENKIAFSKHNNTLILKFAKDKQLASALYRRGYKYIKDKQHWEMFLHDREICFIFKKLAHWKRTPSAQEILKQKKNLQKSVQIKQIGNPSGILIADFCNCFKSSYVQYSDLNEITRSLSMISGDICLITAPENKKNPSYCPEAKVFSYNEMNKIPSGATVIVDEIYNFSPSQKRSKTLIKNCSRFNKVVLMSQRDFNQLELSVIVLLMILDEKLDMERISNRYVHSLSTSKHIQLNAILYKEIYSDYSFKLIFQNTK